MTDEKNAAKNRASGSEPGTPGNDPGLFPGDWNEGDPTDLGPTARIYPKSRAVN